MAAETKEESGRAALASAYRWGRFQCDTEFSCCDRCVAPEKPATTNPSARTSRSRTSPRLRSNSFRFVISYPAAAEHDRGPRESEDRTKGVFETEAEDVDRGQSVWESRRGAASLGLAGRLWFALESFERNLLPPIIDH